MHRLIKQNMVKEGYVFSINDFKSYSFICKEQKIMYCALKQDINFAKYLKINYKSQIQKNREINLYEYALNKGYIPTLNDFINNNYLQQQTCFENYFRNIITTIIFQIKTNKFLIKNEQVVIYTALFRRKTAFPIDDIKKEFFLAIINQNNRFIKYLIPFHENNISKLTQEISSILVKDGFVPLEIDFLKNKQLGKIYFLIAKAIEINPYLIKYIQLNENKNIIINNEFLPNYLLFQKSIDKGYKPNKSDIKNNSYLSSSTIIMKKAIELDPTVIEDSPLIYDLWNYAIVQGYVPNFNNLKNNKYIFEIAKSKDNKKIKWLNDLLMFFYKNSPEFINNPFLKEFFNNENIPSVGLLNIIKMWDFINNDEVYKSMSYDEMIIYIKFVYCSITDNSNREVNDFNNLRKKLNKIISEKKYFNFKKIINIIIQDKQINIKSKLNLMDKIIINFDLYYDFCCLFLDSNYSLSDINLLMKILSMPDFNYPISSLEDLRKIKYLIFVENKKDIERPNINNYGQNKRTIIWYYNKILLMLLNINYSYYINNIANGFSSNEIDDLIININDTSAKKELYKYKALICLIEKILKITDIEILKELAHKLNESIFNNSTQEYIYFIDFDDIKKYYYGIEIQEKMLDLSSLKPTTDKVLENYNELINQPYIKYKNKFKCPYFNLLKKLNPDYTLFFNKDIDYIELNGIKFTMFIHTLNAYGIGGTIESFIKQRFNGKTYICVTPITDENWKGMPSKIDNTQFILDQHGTTKEEIETNILLQFLIDNSNKNNVRLIFTNVSPEQIVGMSNNNLFTHGGNNSLNITTAKSLKYLPIRKMVKSVKKDFCEYILYRENSNGQLLYPTGVLSLDSVPTNAELLAASQLGIPIVHINNVYNLETKKFQSNDNNFNTDYFKELLKELELKIFNEQLIVSQNSQGVKSI